MKQKEYKKRINACLDKLYYKGLAWKEPIREACVLMEESLEILKRRIK